MLKGFTQLSLLIITLVFFWNNEARSQSTDKSAETVVHLLGYIARDYPAGVQDGKIADEQEYSEMVEFSAQVYRLTNDGAFLPKKKQDILKEIVNLQHAIDQKKNETEISGLATRIKDEIIAITGLQTAPASWPAITKGKTLYLANCATCHGDKGNGAGQMAASLNPPPTNFQDSGLMGQVSPYQAYNTIKLGVQGTSMRSFPELNEQDVWDLAFYIKSLSFQNQNADSQQLRNDLAVALNEVTLKDVATLSDDGLMAKLSGNRDAQEKLLALRTLSVLPDESNNSLSIARKNLEAAVDNYAKGDRSAARTLALNAYLEGIEPVEARLRANDPGFVLKLEQQMMAVRQAIEKNSGETAVKEEVSAALNLIDQADGLLKGQKLNYWLTFLLAGSIMLREGLEAFLIIAIVLALIRSSGVKKAVPWLHGGWITAVLVGIAGWFLSDYIIRFGGKNRETMEGAIAIIAVVVLISMGFWLHSKTEAKKWTEFIRDKITKYLQKDKMYGLAAFAFVVVFREAFEVILFLKAVSLEASEGNQSAIGIGVLTAVACIIIMVYLFLKYSAKIPIRQLFRYSSWFIILLAVILMGKGTHSLQESGLIPVNGISAWPVIDWLGIYPTLETLLSQLLIIGLVVATYSIRSYQMKKAVAHHHI